jgi:hypothetical protein
VRGASPCPGQDAKLPNQFVKEGFVMDLTTISAFAGLSIVIGLIVAFGTQSLIRGLFISLVFLGFTLTAFLIELGVDEVLSFFLGQAIIVGSTYIYLRRQRTGVLKKIGREFATSRSSGCH